MKRELKKSASDAAKAKEHAANLQAEVRQSSFRTHKSVYKRMSHATMIFDIIYGKVVQSRFNLES